MAIILNKPPVTPSRGFGDTSIKIERTPFMDAPPQAPTKNSIISNTSGLNSNHIRSKLFKNMSSKLRPDSKYVTRYENFLADEYVKALRKQLNIRFRYASGTHKNVGYATGNLSRKIDASSSVTIIRHRSNGKIDINYKLHALYPEYGKYLSEERSPSIVPYWALRRWVNVKIKQGSFRINTKPSSNKSRKGKAASESRAERIDNIVWGIQKKAAKERRPAVLKNWNNFDKNERLRRMYFSAVKKKGSYLRSQIRRSIIRNITKNK